MAATSWSANGWGARRARSRPDRASDTMPREHPAPLIPSLSNDGPPLVTADKLRLSGRRCIYIEGA